jgi:hypothetical protein
MGIIAALVVLAGLLAAGLLFGGQLFSPGALSAQGRGPALSGVTSHAEIAACSACHAPFWSPDDMAKRCLDCHVDLAQDPQDFHNVMAAQGRLTGCRDCHTDHNGAGAALTVLDTGRFPHDSTRFALRAHQQHADGQLFVCADCHTGDFKAPPAAVCADCHRQLDAAYMETHLATFGDACLDCHDGLDSLGVFDHGQVVFTLTGQHLSLACDSCHTGARSLADLRATPQDCYTCHFQDDHHAGGFGTNCAACHSAEGWALARVDHSLTAFPLTGVHLITACQDCHTNGVFTGAPTACAGCHAADDAHAGQLGADCALCHTPAGWQPPTFDHTGFLLTGQHAAAACQSCHAGGVFTGMPTTCAGCHAADDAHAGQLGADCALCHTPAGWQPPTFDHTNFALTGQHTLAACQGCHRAGPGGVVFKGTPTTCYACHAADDSHAGDLGPDCATCHTPAGWQPPTFDHSATLFPLVGAHLTTACRDCHVKGPAGVVFGGTATVCVACHAAADPHAGQFGADCALCHSPVGWLPVTFNHALTLFPLTGAHLQAACTGCHSGGVFAGTPNACSSCHADPAYHLGLFGYSCATCHTTSAWVPANYTAAHSFPMRHGDQLNTCRACHPSSLAAYSCYGCHAANDVTREHQKEGISNFQDCMRCHPTGQEGGD